MKLPNIVFNKVCLYTTWITSVKNVQALRVPDDLKVELVFANFKNIVSPSLGQTCMDSVPTVFIAHKSSLHWLFLVVFVQWSPFTTFVAFCK